MTDRELLQQALDELLHLSDGLDAVEIIKALQTRLAQPEKEWVCLTDDEIRIIATYGRTNFSKPAHEEFARSIEARLKDKNDLG
jgi:hypothetical protein